MARLRIVNDRADDSTVTLHRVIVPRGLQSLCETYIEAGYILKLFFSNWRNPVKGKR